MVAVTVVLSAAVGVFVMDAFSVDEGVTAGVSVGEKTNTYEVQLVDRGNADRILIESPEGTQELTRVGEAAHVDRSDCQVTVIGERDGKREVLQSFVASVDRNAGDLKAHWAYEDCQVDGNTILDASGQQQGTIEGTVNEGADGIKGDAFDFPGQDGYISIGTRGEFHNTSVSLWVKPRTDDEGWLAGHGAKWRIKDIPSEDNFLFWIREVGGPSDGAAYSVKGGPGTDITGEWWHVVGTYNVDTTELRLYVNGQLVAAETSGLVINADAHDNMVIGDGWEGDGRYADATMDETRLYSKTLSPMEVEELCERDAPDGHPCST